MARLNYQTIKAECWGDVADIHLRLGVSENILRNWLVSYGQTHGFFEVIDQPETPPGFLHNPLPETVNLTEPELYHLMRRLVGPS